MFPALTIAWTAILIFGFANANNGSEIKSVLSGKCLDIVGGKNSDGVNIQIFTCYGWDAQAWYYNSSTKRIKNVNGKCLDVAAYGNENGTNVQLWTCDNDNTNNNQKWILYEQGTIESMHTHGCLTVSGTKDGTNVYVTTCHNDENQLWFGPLLPIETHTSWIKTMLVSGKCLDIRGGVPSDGAIIQTFDCYNWDSQKWYYFPQTMQIKNINGKCLDFNINSANDNENVQLFSCHSGDNQQWILSEDGSIKSKVNEKCLDIAGYGSSNGVNVHVLQCHNTSTNQLNQLWFRSLSLKTCPAGSIQVGGLDADISGCGLDGCRTDIDSIEDCFSNCVANKDCKAFNWSPIGGTNGPNPICVIYPQSMPTKTWGNNNLVFCQMLYLSKND